MTEPDTFRLRRRRRNPEFALPLLVYRQAVPADAAAIERIFTANRWPAAWRGPVIPFQHFHSEAHEVLGVAEGQTQVQFGGPNGQVLTVRAGDVVVVPAGGRSLPPIAVGRAGHRRRLPRQHPRRDLRHGDPAEHAEVVRNVSTVPLPQADPVAGADGPLGRIWGR